MARTLDATVVTGATSGLGRATTERFASEGSAVFALDLSASSVPMSERVPSVEYWDLDIRDDEAVRRTFARIADAAVVRSVIHCAGVTGFSQERPGHLVSPETGVVLENLEVIQEVVTTNLLGSLSVVRHAASCMARTPSGTEGERGVIVVIVPTSSGAGLEGKAGQSAYTASKAAVAGMTLGLARELSPHGIRVVTIAPGLFDTPILADTPRLERHVPFPNRRGRPEEFAALAHHVVENTYLNAEVIRLDGGTRGGFVHQSPFVG